jgi:polygalacturonase
VISLLVLAGCHLDSAVSDPIAYSCGSTSEPASAVAGDPSDCGDIDATLPPEPTFPPDPTDPSCIIKADETTDDNNWIPAEDNVTADSLAVNTALNNCQVVKLIADGAKNAIVTSHININGSTLWVDRGVTLFASRNADLFQKVAGGNCGVTRVNDSQACTDFITVGGSSPAIIGEGIIDGQGGEPIIAGGQQQDYSWWQLSGALQMIDGSIGNPTLINLSSGTTQFLMYKITLHNSPKFHVKITSTPPTGAACNRPGDGFIVWGITILTPSRWFNSQGLLMSPHFARNSDGVDPGETSAANCGLIAHNTISTGDDQIAVKGGHGIAGLTIVHNHFGTGHGMSIGSETYGGVHGMTVCDLTIDADSRPVGDGASPGDFNGIRVKSDSSRGGVVDQVTFRNICMRDVTNAILISTAYNPLFEGTLYPQFKTLNFQNIHGETCMGLTQPVVTLNGFSNLYPAGPITLDNVFVDNLGPQAEEAEFASFNLGPGQVNFTPSGQSVTILSDTRGPSTPINCVFPTLPAPQPPPGWLR